MASGGTGIQKPNIRGGDYTAIDTQDGWYILKDIPTLAPVKKGKKYATEDIGEEWFNSALKFAQDCYTNGKVAHPIHLTHTDDAGIHNPEFAGYFKPSKVGKMTVPDKGEVPVVFSDFKIKKNIYEKMAKGELGYVSPEVRGWEKKRISSVALLDSVPPENLFPLMTIGETKVDPTAQFATELPEGCSIARFSDGVERIKFDHRFDPMDSKEEKSHDESKEKAERCCSHCKANQETLTKLSNDIYGGKMESGKPDSAPIEQKGEPEKTKQGAMANIRMEDDPKAVARFAALEDSVSALKKQITERDQAEKSKLAADKALAEDLKGYQIGEKTKAAVYKFAAEGEDRLKAYVESVKEVAIKDGPRSLYEAELAGAVKLNDPVIAKFGGNDPGKMETVARFAADYRTLKKSPAGKGMRITEEEWIAQAVKEAEMGGKV
jgi:hypothetical protein